MTDINTLEIIILVLLAIITLGLFYAIYLAITIEHSQRKLNRQALLQRCDPLVLASIL